MAPARVCSFTSADGTPLRADYYADGPRASRGLVVIVHGYCEHRRRYVHVAEQLVNQGYAVLCGDLRGHGESAGARGFINRFGSYLEDVSAFLAHAHSLFVPPLTVMDEGMPTSDVDAPQRPILIGHSLGGLVALSHTIVNPGVVRALVVSSPLLGIKQAIPGWKRGLALAASSLYPTLRLPNDVDPRNLSHDAAVCQSYAKDPLVSHEGTARWFTETLAAQASVRAQANRIRTATLFLQAGDDRIVDEKASQVVFDRVGARDKTLNVYPGLFHEIFNEREPDRQRVLNDLIAWLNDR